MGGNWGSWLPWSPCSETCGRGVQSRIRLCNNPPPAFDGSQCVGTDTQTQMCKEKPCPGKDAIMLREKSPLRPGFRNSLNEADFSFIHFVSSSGWEVVVLGELGSLQCFLWGGY